jgi:hypothetical protein
MSEQSTVLQPKDLIQVQRPSPAEPPVPQQPAAAPSLEEIRAVDEAFKSKEENDLAAGLLTLWANTPLLIELAKEHFAREKAVAEPHERPKDE